MLRHAADVRSIIYLAFTAVLAVVQWNLPHFSPPLYILALFMAISVAVISHNHNHLAMWKSKWANLVTSYVISVHYGHPAIGWVPTHNQVHHKLNNKPGDSSRSPKFFKKNHLLALLVYPTLTSMTQTKEINAYMKGLWRRDKKAFAFAFSEYVVFFGFMVGIFFLNWKKALLFYLIPQQVSLFVIQVFNYVQHVEADENSAWNHSRNFVSPVLNALLFNNGIHTVHHFKPGVHWSQTPVLHAEHVHKIHPALLEPSFFRYIGWTFFARPFVPGAAAPCLIGELPPSPTSHYPAEAA